MRDKEISEKFISQFLSEQLFAILSTQSDKGPHGVIVSFAATTHLKEIIFVTPTHTRKYENLQGNSKISLYIDNRSNKITDIERLCGIEVKGKAYEVAQSVRNIYREIFLNKYPVLEDFIDSPGSVIVRIEVEQFEVINHFQNVTTLVMP